MTEPIEIEFRDRARPVLAQRWGVAIPGVYNATGRAVRSLPLPSRLRRAMIRRAVTDALAAYNRRDWDAVLLNIAPDVELIPPRDFVALGFEPVYHGHDGYVTYHQQWIEHWGEFKVIPTKLFDLGERMVVLGQMGGRELRSDIPMDTEFGTVDSFEAARSVEQRVFLKHAEALEAAGLRD